MREAMTDTETTAASAFALAARGEEVSVVCACAICYVQATRIVPYHFRASKEEVPSARHRRLPSACPRRTVAHTITFASRSM